jgi:hypothetical protein
MIRVPAVAGRSIKIATGCSSLLYRSVPRPEGDQAFKTSSMAFCILVIVVLLTGTRGNLR